MTRLTCLIPQLILPFILLHQHLRRRLCNKVRRALRMIAMKIGHVSLLAHSTQTSKPNKILERSSRADTSKSKHLLRRQRRSAEIHDAHALHAINAEPWVDARAGIVWLAHFHGAVGVEDWAERLAEEGLLKPVGLVDSNYHTSVDMGLIKKERYCVP